MEIVTLTDVTLISSIFLGSCEIDGGNFREGKAYELVLKRLEQRTEMSVNNRSFVSEVKLEAFQVGTELFIGGLAPGIAPNVKLDVFSYFEGCIHNVCC